MAKRGRSVLISDAQVHAPGGTGLPIPGIDFEPLVMAMAEAGVDRAVLVPMTHDSWKNSLEFCDRAPGKFVVMAVLPLGDRRTTVAELEQLADTPGIAGIRISTYTEPAASLLAEGRLNWLFERIQELDIRVAMNTMGQPTILAEIARRYPGIMFMLDHLGLDPLKRYSDFDPPIHEIVQLANLENIAVKATCMPAAVAEGYPFSSLHDPLQQVIEAFGVTRVFWGSDLSRLPCSYLECKELFTKELKFLSQTDIGWLMGGGLAHWLRWSE